MFINSNKYFKSQIKILISFKRAKTLYRYFIKLFYLLFITFFSFTFFNSIDNGKDLFSCFLRKKKQCCNTKTLGEKQSPNHFFKMMSYQRK